MKVTIEDVVLVNVISHLLYTIDAERKSETIYVDELSNVTVICPYLSFDEMVWRSGNTTYAIGNKVKSDFVDKMYVSVDPITGLHNLQIMHYSRDDEQNYTCVITKEKQIASNYTCVITKEKQIASKSFYILIKRLPSDVKILNSVNKTIHTKEGEPFTMTCNVTSGIPPENIKWKNGDKILQEGGPGTLAYTFTPEQTNHLQKYECVVNNSATNYISDDVFVNVQWKPNVSVAAFPISVTEGNNVTIECVIDSNPSPSEINWYIIDQRYSSNTTTSYKNHWILANIHRNQSGTYGCNARNDVGDGHDYIKLDVKYPPSIQVKIKSEDEENVTFNCNPKGNPANYSFSPWEHVSFSGEHIRYISGSSDGQLLLKTIDHQYMNSGRYICNATNGIPPKTRSYIENSVSYIYSGRPMFSPTNEVDHFGVFGKQKNMKFYVYSHPELMELSFVNEKYNTTNKIQIPVNHTLIEEHFSGKKIKMEGYIFIIQLDALIPIQFSNYTIVAINIKGSSTYSFQLISANRPETPTIIKALPQVRSIVIVWERNFDGGYPQVFVVELQSDSQGPWMHHLNITDSNKENDSVVIDGLNPGELYNIRMLAKNCIGKSNFTNVIKIKTLKESSIKTTVALYGTTVVGLTVLIIAFTWIIITKKYSGVQFRCKQKRNEVLAQQSTGEIFSSENVVMNNIYDLEDINADVGADHGCRTGQDIRKYSHSVLQQEEHELNYLDVGFESQPSHHMTCIHGIEDRTIYSEVDFCINLNASTSSESDDDSSDDDFIYIDDIVQYAVPK